MHINRYLPFALIYFFLNSIGLPTGLTYTALLTPILYWWVISTRKKEILLPFFLVLFPFIFVHVNIVGVDSNSYKKSLLNLAAVYVFCQAFYTFLKTCKDPEKIFRKILFINFILCLVAIPFYFTPFFDIFWIEQDLGAGINNVRRLKLFTYEASYYATLFAPLFFYFFLQIILKQNKKSMWMLFAMLLLPLILSFSIGVISCILISISISLLFYFRFLLKKRRLINIIVLLLAAIVPTVLVLVVFFPHNVLFERMGNILAGNDPSGRGRTSEAFTLANILLDQKNYFWGIGIGQVKIIGGDIIRNFYQYPPDYDVISIPNVTAETLVLFGWIGLCLRFIIEIFLFFYTRVWNNYFRMLLFIFIFVYQFTGSFITNIAEYVIWILAFTNVFGSFDVKRREANGVMGNG
jgi:hypothetical protein